MIDEQLEDVERWLAGGDVARDDRAEIEALGVHLLTKREAEGDWSLELARIVDRHEMPGRYGATCERVLCVVVVRGTREGLRARLALAEVRHGAPQMVVSIHADHFRHWRDALDQSIAIVTAAGVEP